VTTAALNTPYFLMIPCFCGLCSLCLNILPPHQPPCSLLIQRLTTYLLSLFLTQAKSPLRYFLRPILLLPQFYPSGRLNCSFVWVPSCCPLCLTLLALWWSWSVFSLKHKLFRWGTGLPWCLEWAILSQHFLSEWILLSISSFWGPQDYGRYGG
jgi:hypothetical protein